MPSREVRLGMQRRVSTPIGARSIVWENSTNNAAASVTRLSASSPLSSCATSLQRHLDNYGAQNNDEGLSCPAVFIATSD